jgi:hypothetical protein
MGISMTMPGLKVRMVNTGFEEMPSTWTLGKKAEVAPQPTTKAEHPQGPPVPGTWKPTNETRSADQFRDAEREPRCNPEA